MEKKYINKETSIKRYSTKKNNFFEENKMFVLFLKTMMINRI